jgi:hypothetical protein
MKVIHKMKNMMIHEFQHSAEDQLIQVMNVKMHRRQFASIRNEIQTRSKVVDIDLTSAKSQSTTPSAAPTQAFNELKTDISSAKSFSTTLRRKKCSFVLFSVVLLLRIDVNDIESVN